MHLATWETEAGGSLKFRRLRSSIKRGGGAGDVTQVVECLPFMQEVWVQFPALYNQGVVASTGDSRTQEVEAGISEEN